MRKAKDNITNLQQENALLKATLGGDNGSSSTSR